MKTTLSIATALAVALFATGAATARDNGTAAPPSAGPYGPLSSADHNHDGTVTRAEIDDFMRDGPYRRYGFVDYFDMLDANQDGYLDAGERANAEPADAFDDVDFNHDGLVSRAEAQDQVGDRLYRQIGVEAWYLLMDLNGDDQISPDEIEAAIAAGQLIPDE